MKPHKLTHAQLGALCQCLQHLLETAADDLQKEVLYAFVTSLAKRWLDMRREYRVRFTKAQAIAFCTTYYNDLSVLDPFVFQTVQPLFEQLDRHYDIIKYRQYEAA